jgi:hypothetical protein
LLQQFDYTPFTISLNKLKTNIIELDKKIIEMKTKTKSKTSKKKTKKKPNRCDSDDVSFIKVKKKLIYSINVLETVIKKMKKIVILPDENNCPEVAIGELVNDVNDKSINLKKNQNANLPIASKVGGSATNDICADYNELVANIREILSKIDEILASKDNIVNVNDCKMVSDIFDKLQISKSKFEEVIEKLNKDKRLSSSLRNGSIMAPNNGPRNNSVKKRSI